MFNDIGSLNDISGHDCPWSEVITGQSVTGYLPFLIVNLYIVIFSQSRLNLTSEPQPKGMESSGTAFDRRCKSNPERLGDFLVYKSVYLFCRVAASPLSPSSLCLHLDLGSSGSISLGC